METKVCFFQFQIIMNFLTLSGSFYYICYGFMVSGNIFTLTVPGSTEDVRISRLQSIPAL